MRPQLLLGLAAALLVPTAPVLAAPPFPNFADLPAYLHALNQSQDPAALAIKAQIDAGPADLARERAAAEKSGIRLSQPQTPLPPAGQNAAPLYDRLDALRKEKPLFLPPYAQPLTGRYAYTPAQIAAAQSVVGSRPDIFGLLHQAADKPQCAFADTSGPLGTSTAFTHYAGLRESAREINTESLLLAYRGQYPEAIANQERGFRIARQAASDHLLISYLVGDAIDAITLSGMQSILSLAGPNAALDSRAASDIRALPPLSLSRALSGDTVLTAGEFAAFHRAAPAALAQAFPQDSPFVGAAPAPAPARFTLAEQSEVSSLLDAAEADYLHQIMRLAAAADAPSAERNAVFGQVAARAQVNEDNPVEALSDLMNPVAALDGASGPGAVARLSDQTQGRRRVTAAGAAVLAAKAQTGTFPAALPSGFTDPFTGRPLGYHAEGTNGFVVYSAGPTGVYEGGKPGEITPPGEIAFRYPAIATPLTPGMLK